ncbi:hypothetical protein ACFSO0_10450 [Brevibacillus sp. GCM10020057]|uniref:hypothetical protein n=1 Tax=Brevibacillus sp. GCM10020057 TaxID=3317327 RepID=UPI00363DD4EB
MDHLCPVCNGLAAFVQHCSRCGKRLDDGGRLYDLYGDYSPYREIDDAKLDNGYPDRQQHQCMHAGWCSQCRTMQAVAVKEWTLQMVDAQKDAYE